MFAWIRSILTWVQKYERQLSAPVFVAGFLNDVYITYGRLPLAGAIAVLGSYVAIAGLATIASHYLYVRRATEGWKLRSARSLLSLLAQFVTGGLLSGCLIFYTRDAALSASWPFIVLVGIVLVGDEFFRHYREALIFRSILFFFTTYIYVVFAYPSLVHSLGASIFLQSTVITIAIFLLFMAGLIAAGWKRVREGLLVTLGSVAVIIAAVNICYFTGVIPPLPLALVDAGIYHSITHTADGYALQGEANTRPWWDVLSVTPSTVHIPADEPLYAFSSIFAPTKFSAGVEHLWQRRDESTHKWITVADISFPINGGRDGGYRGYTEIRSATPGEYRVTIRTLSKQVIGRIYFTVLTVPTEPELVTQTR